MQVAQAVAGAIQRYPVAVIPRVISSITVPIIVAPVAVSIAIVIIASVAISVAFPIFTAGRLELP
jgi:hypothetical protein